VLPVSYFASYSVLPIQGMIDPALDLVLIKTLLFNAKRSVPIIIESRDHPLFSPGALVLVLVKHRSRDHVMTVYQYVGTNFYPLPYNSLDVELPAIDLRAHPLNDYSLLS
jgi:hypothetical protein